MLEFVALHGFPNFLRSTDFQPVVLASADTDRRVFTGSETVTDVALRPGLRGSHSGAASAWPCQIRRLPPFATLLERLPRVRCRRGRARDLPGQQKLAVYVSVAHGILLVGP